MTKFCVLTAIAWTLTASAGQAWQADQIGGLCTLSHAEEGNEIRLTYDPTGPLYTIEWTLAGAWPNGTFAIAFDGARPNVISTDRAVISDDGASISVADRGFGNVLDGLRFNQTATAIAGDVSATVSLEGAGRQVDAFEACEAAPSV